MIILDFYSGSHGHFLEYVINTFVFNGPKVNNIFTNLGASHLIRNDDQYMRFRIIEANHYSEFDIVPNGKVEKVVNIVIDDDLGKSCYQINVVERVGDIPREKKEFELINTVKQFPKNLRNDYYSKLMFAECGYKVPGAEDCKFKQQNIECYDFQMSDLYNVQTFYKSLADLAKFLDQKFCPDRDLYTTWEKFIEYNQGLKIHQKCQQVLQAVLSDRDVAIKLSVIEQALLNKMLSEIFNVFDGVLFDSNEYPDNTKLIYKIIQEHLNNFDSRF